jgi:hypothetical protein
VYAKVIVDGAAPKVVKEPRGDLLVRQHMPFTEKVEKARVGHLGRCSLAPTAWRGWGQLRLGQFLCGYIGVVLVSTQGARMCRAPGARACPSFHKMGVWLFTTSRLPPSGDVSTANSFTSTAFRKNGLARNS